MSSNQFLKHLSLPLTAAVSKGKRSARVFQRAWILLLADKGMKDEEISDFIKVSPRTVERTRGMRLLRWVIDEVSTEIRILLKKHDLKPWKKNMSIRADSRVH